MGSHFLNLSLDNTLDVIYEKKGVEWGLEVGFFSFFLIFFSWTKFRTRFWPRGHVMKKKGLGK